MKSPALILVLVSCLCSTAPGYAQTAAKAVVPPTQSVQGLTQAEWSRAWWQWAGSFEKGESPISDLTGALCGLRQSGPVWFLAGTYGSRRAVRTCKVPQGKYLFFPLVNSLITPRGDIPVDCDYVTKGAASMMEGKRPANPS